MKTDTFIRQCFINCLPKFINTGVYCIENEKKERKKEIFKSLFF